MPYKDINHDLSSEEILKILDENKVTAQIMVKKIASLKDRQLFLREEEKVEEISNVDSPLIKDNPLQEEITFYLSRYQALDTNFNDEDLIDILPVDSNYHFYEIIHRLQAESLRTIKEYLELSREEITDDDREVILEEIACEKRKIALLNGVLLSEEKGEKTDVKHNNIVLIPNSSGNITILDDMKKIDGSFYKGFIDLVNSIIDGSFKGVKQFTNNGMLQGLSEVRGNKTRILFVRLSKDTYGLITAFVKKSDNSAGYRSFIISRYNDYKNVASTIQSMIGDDDFIRENELNVEELFNIMDPNGKEYKKVIK